VVEPMIQLARGETTPLQFNLYDDEGTPVDITNYNQVKFGLSSAPHTGVLITRDSSTDSASEISVQASPAQVTIYLTDEESQALPLGILYADVWVKLDGKWSRIQKLVRVEVVEGIGHPGE